MKLTAQATCLSWIPPQAVEGSFKLPFGLGVAHYDAPPPDTSPDVDALLDADAVRFANQLQAWIQVDDGRITAQGMAGGGRLGSTTLRLGSQGMTFAGVALPDLLQPPEVRADRVRFVLTAGGHTGVAVPRAIPHPPFWRLTAPIAWSTVGLTIHADGSSDAKILDASAFPRHYLYDSTGRLTYKSALIRYKDWLRRSEERTSPWAGVHERVPVAEVGSQLERSLGDAILVSGAYDQQRLPAGGWLSDLPIAEDQVHLLLDGLLVVNIDDEPAVEVGPGAVYDPRTRPPESTAHVRVAAKTPCRLALMARGELDADALLGVSSEKASRFRAVMEQREPAQGEP
jgi:hypothetical protein